MRTQLWLSLPILLSLSGCGSLHVKGESPATDLLLVKEGVIALAKERRASGDVQRLEDAETMGQVFNYAGELEDINYLHHQDKQAIVQFVTRSMQIMEKGRLESCSWFNLSCKARVRRTKIDGL